MVKVPDLTGKTQEDARKALKDAGLEGGNTSQEDSATVAKDRVIYTNPPAGNSVARGTTVDLVLSTGNTSVPDVSGQDEATAKKSCSSRRATTAPRRRSSAARPSPPTRPRAPAPPPETRSPCTSPAARPK